MAEEGVRTRDQRDQREGGEGVREMAEFGKTRDLGQLIDRNSTRQVNVRAVEVRGGESFRSGFLSRQIDPLLEPDQTLGSFLSKLESTGRQLGQLANVRYDLDTAPGSNPRALFGPIDLKAVLHLDRDQASAANLTVTTADDQAAQFDATAIIQNVAGGAESLRVSGSAGLPPRSQRAIGLDFDVPLSGAIARLSSAYSYRDLPWASHSQELLSVSGSIISHKNSSALGAVRSQLGVQLSTRNVYNVKSSASDSVRVDAGHSGKTSVIANWSADNSTREGAYLVGGYRLNVDAERAFQIGSKDDGSSVASSSSSATSSSLSFLPGEVSFSKAAVDAQFAKSLDPGSNRLVVNLNGGAGLLWGNSGSSILDRFFIGDRPSLGPQYGYEFNGTGPRDLEDSIGGDGFYGASLGLYGKLPRLPLTSPLRVKFGFAGASAAAVDSSSDKPLSQLFSLAPSTGAFFGIAYRSGPANVELGYVVPLSSRASDVTKRGLQFGVTLAL